MDKMNNLPDEGTKMIHNDQNTYVCRGECLFGKCPNPYCVKARKGGEGTSLADREMHILTHTGGLPEKGDRVGTGLAVDIGSTTVVALLIDLAHPQIKAKASCVNGQAAWGPDVISRIQVCREQPDGLAQLRDSIRKDLNRLFARLEGEVCRASITGNTLMLALLAGLDPSAMGEAPFTPPSLFGEEYTPEELGLDLPAGIPVYLAPCVSPFVGGDISTGMLATGFDKPDKVRLLVDVGTNGELALQAGDKLVTASTAAGPALEGAELSCGMGGVPGAVSAIELARGKARLTVIGGGTPAGLCGSGVLDGVAFLLDHGFLDEMGLLDEDRLRSAGLLGEEGEALFAPGVALSQGDIRKIQLAKSAIHAGILALCHKAGVDPEEVEEVLLAGGFGNYLRVESALRIGLLPACFAGKILPAGNSALTGAVWELVSPPARDTLFAIVHRSQSADLATDPVFMEQFVEQMLFPEE